MWIDNDDRITDILNDTERVSFPAACPACGEKAAHLYYHRYSPDSDRGGLWIWCSSCRLCSHSSCRVPRWWNNHSMIKLSKLAGHPDHLEEHKDIIDEWVNSIRQGEKNNEKPQT